MSEQHGQHGRSPLPRRVLVTSPRTRARRSSPGRPVRREIDEQTGLGEVYMGLLVRAQLRLALVVCLVLATLVAGLPLLFTVEPTLRAVRVLGLPLPWLLLGGAVYPFLLVAAWGYVRAAERNEREFAELVERS